MNNSLNCFLSRNIATDVHFVQEMLTGYLYSSNQNKFILYLYKTKKKEKKFLLFRNKRKVKNK